jgi:linker between RRM2 and RRM3 domains in RBM39 protein
MNRRKSLLRIFNVEVMLTFSPKPLSQIAPPEVSRCVLLKNCFNPAEESGTAWVKELEEDVKHECEEKYGKVCVPFQILTQPLGEPYSRRRRLQW